MAETRWKLGNSQKNEWLGLGEPAGQGEQGEVGCPTPPSAHHLIAPWGSVWAQQQLAGGEHACTRRS